jgi:hypothetical protein
MLVEDRDLAIEDQRPGRQLSNFNSGACALTSTAASAARRRASGV